jgi:hypothetical protein
VRALELRQFGGPVWLEGKQHSLVGHAGMR